MQAGTNEKTDLANGVGVEPETLLQAAVVPTWSSGGSLGRAEKSWVVEADGALG